MAKKQPGKEAAPLQNPGPVEEYLQTELAAGRIVGPFQEGEIPAAQVSRFGVIPKANQPNRWRDRVL